jgi:hypothetical protein
MELRIWKRIYLSPFARLNLYTKGFTISLGHRAIGWITFSMVFGKASVIMIKWR